MGKWQGGEDRSVYGSTVFIPNLQYGWNGLFFKSFRVPRNPQSIGRCLKQRKKKVMKLRGLKALASITLIGGRGANFKNQNRIMKRTHALVEVDSFGTPTIIGLIDCDVFNNERLHSLIKELLAHWLVNYNVSDETLNEYADELSRERVVRDGYRNTYRIQWCIKIVTE